MATYIIETYDHEFCRLGQVIHEWELEQDAICAAFRTAKYHMSIHPENTMAVCLSREVGPGADYIGRWVYIPENYQWDTDPAHNCALEANRRLPE